jgi:hypothetical protein
MAHRIEDIGGILEVKVWGDTSKQDLLAIIMELQRRDPGKKCMDLWMIDSDCIIPFSEFHRIVEGIHSLCPPGMVGSRSAIVAFDSFQQAQLEMYRAEASILPFEMRVFGSRADAVEWLRSPPAPVVGRRGDRPAAEPGRYSAPARQEYAGGQP